MGIMIGVVLFAALGLLPIMASALIGVGLMLAGRCLTWNEAWSAIDARMVLVIVTSLALGTSLTVTGAAETLAIGLVGIVDDLPPPLIISGLLLITALLTEVVTNNAVAVIATPIAMSIAAKLGLEPLPFVLAVLFGANMSYLTPIGYQTNLLVMSAGGYQFSDFFRAGLPLQLLLWVVLSVTLSWLYL
jgi:di/tricarboxylate transporter